MVDPNRKINRLTEKDVDFLDECEREFATRYTSDDAAFMAHCNKPVKESPIHENWAAPSGNNAAGGGNRNNSFNHRYNNGPRPWQRRDGNQNRNRYRYNPMQRGDRYTNDRNTSDRNTNDRNSNDRYNNDRYSNDRGRQGGHNRWHGSRDGGRDGYRPKERWDNNQYNERRDNYRQNERYENHSSGPKRPRRDH